jgi:hypothetical protein
MSHVSYHRRASQLGAKPSEFVTLALGQLYTAVDLVAEDAILGDQIVIAQPEAVVDRL